MYISSVFHFAFYFSFCLLDSRFALAIVKKRIALPRNIVSYRNLTKQLCFSLFLPFCFSVEFIYAETWIAIYRCTKFKNSKSKPKPCVFLIWFTQPPNRHNRKLFALHINMCVFMLDSVFVGCSVSLSSLDSEEQESLRTERLHNRSSRNSTGGISTHSLNEAELAVCIHTICIKFVSFLVFLLIICSNLLSFIFSLLLLFRFFPVRCHIICVWFVPKNEKEKLLN